MAIRNYNRTIRPSSREPESSYRVNLSKLNPGDIAEITIDHESDPFVEVYNISYEELQGKSNIHFLAYKQAGKWKVEWRAGIRPKKIR